MLNVFFEKTGQGPALFILHGLFGSGDNWRTVAKPLAEHYTVYFVDLRNHGRAPHTATTSYPEMAADILALCEAEKLNKVSIIGHSMGGKVAMTFALNYPERMDQLIVADMGIRAYPPHHADILAGLHAVDLSTLTQRFEAEQILSGHITDKGIVQFLLKGLYRTDAGFAWRFNLDTLTRDYNNILSGVSASQPYDKPVLFIRGEKSNYVRDADFPAIQELFPLATLVTIADAGHWVHADKPQQFMQAVMQFLHV
jgi:pimeloyl-ACP methyl ester carboxylesterase